MRALLAPLLLLALATAAGAEDTTTPAPAETTAPAPAGRRIVLDPGHGGSDAGAGGPAGLNEKAAVLGLALAVAERLEAAGHSVHLTRADDQDLTDAGRAAAANQWQGELFLSLHASGLARPQARGFEVFIAPAPQEVPPGAWARGAAPGSRGWAQAVRQALGQRFPTFDRGLAILPSPLLEGVAAPACLLELGNLGWPPEAELFTTPEGHGQVADALADAVRAFFATVPAAADGQ